MADRAPEERLAAHLLEGIACLRRGDPRQAQLHLRPVVRDEALAASPELADVRARALTLLAQALIDTEPDKGTDGLSALDEAEALLDEAEGLDEEATHGVAALRDALLDARTHRVEAAARASRSTRLAQTDIEPLLARIADPTRRLDLMLHKAQADLQAGRPGDAVVWLERVMASDSSDLRHPVMARLTLAAAQPERAAALVLESYDLAEAASEFNLVATVGRTAELLSVPLPKLHGPSGGSDA